MPEGQQTSDGSKTVTVYLCRCKGEISQRVSLEEVAKRIATQSGACTVDIHDALCSDEGRAFIKMSRGDVASRRVVIGACSPEVLDTRLTRDLEEAGVNKYLVDQVDLREQCSWVHSDKKEASSKACALVWGAVQRVLKQEPLDDMTFPVTGTALIVGASGAGTKAAQMVAESGFKAYLVDQTDQDTAEDDSAGDDSRPSIGDSELGENVRLFLRSHIESIDGGVGKWAVKVETPGGVERFEVGTALIATTSPSQAASEKSESTETAPSESTRRILQMLKIGRGEDMTVRRLVGGRLPDINRGFLVLESSMGLQDAVPPLEDAASAAEVLIGIMRKGTTSIPRIIARVEEYRCRGCGKCADVCEYGAISLVEREGGIKVAHIDESRCEGCGLCRVACCNGSMALLGYTTTQLLANMMGIIEEMSS